MDVMTAWSAFAPPAQRTDGRIHVSPFRQCGATKSGQTGWMLAGSWYSLSRLGSTVVDELPYDGQSDLVPGARCCCCRHCLLRNDNPRRTFCLFAPLPGPGWPAQSQRPHCIVQVIH